MGVLSCSPVSCRLHAFQPSSDAGPASMCRRTGRHTGMNSKRRSIALLTAGLMAVVATVAGGAGAAQDRTAGAPDARAAATVIRVWTDKDRRAAVDSVVGEWA